MIINPDKIPIELRSLRSWAYWKYVVRKNSAKRAKKPFDALTDRPADVNVVEQWSDCTYAISAMARRVADGIGLNLTAPYVGVDLDKCRNRDTGQIAAWAEEIVG